MRPTNGEGRVAPHDAAPKSLPNQHPYFVSAPALDQELHEELTHFASLKSKLSDRGYSLNELSCGGLLIARWNLTKNAPDLRAVGRFLRLIGGAS